MVLRMQRRWTLMREVQKVGRERATIGRRKSPKPEGHEHDEGGGLMLRFVEEEGWA
jgi:hypothetical protein